MCTRTFPHSHGRKGVTDVADRDNGGQEGEYREREPPRCARRQVDFSTSRIIGPWPDFACPIAWLTSLTAALGIGSH
jgi:hypothetical protein